MITLFALVGLIACSGETPAPAPVTPAPEVTPAEPVPAPTPAPVPEAKVDLTTMSEADQHAWLLKKGQEVYESGGSGGIACTTCHQADGKGVPDAFPPLVGQKDMMGECTKHAGLVVNGFTGPITVDGKPFNGAMPAQGNLPDEEIAAVISYERNSFGNNFGFCMPADVATARTLPAPVLK